MYVMTKYAHKKFIAMISVLLLFGLGLNTEYPMERFSCGVNADGAYYNLEEFEKRSYPEVFNDTEIGMTVYLRMCGGLRKSDVPSYATDYENYAAIGCLHNTEICLPLASKFSQEYKKMPTTNQGFIMYYNGQPVDTDANNIIWHFTFSARCDSSQHSADINLIPTIKHETESLISISYEFGYKGACPAEVEAPTPTPAYNPQCDHTARLPDMQTYGIDLDLRESNDGPGGLTYKTTINNEPYYIFYQPCERIMKCPGEKCNSDWSSMWLCTGNMSSCLDYGHVDEHMTIDTDSKDLSEPTYVHMMGTNDGRKSEVVIKCDDNFFDNHFYFKDATLSEDGYFLSVDMNSPEVCLKEIPPPVPIDPEHCYIYDTDPNKVHVDFNASESNIENGYVKDIEFTGILAPLTRTVYFQPCAGLYCPKDADCDQFEDAYLWVCKPIMVEGDNQMCAPYGLFERKITISQVSESLRDGIRITYLGGDSLTAHVNYVCNESLSPGKLVLPDKATMTKSATVLEMTVQSRDVCPTVAVRPFYPPYPKPATATPTPLPSPNPVLYVEEGNFYILIDLSQMDSIVRNSYHVIYSQGKSNTFHVYRTNWIGTGCPEGYKCDGYEDTWATWWGCWTDSNDENVCFPIADRSYGVDISQQNQSISSAVYVRYQGHGGTDTEIILTCDHSGETRYFPIIEPMSYHSGRNGPEYGFVGTSALACPREFLTPSTPSYTATPTPLPNAESQNSAKCEQKITNNGLTIELDLTDIETAEADVVMGWPDRLDYEKVRVKISMRKRVSCITGYDCGGFDAANIWKCWTSAGKSTCIPMGDLRYGLTIGNMTENLTDGLYAQYVGGLGGYETKVVLRCNESIPDTELVIDRVAQKRDTSVTIFAETGHVCIGHHPYIQSGVTGGAVFLVVVITAVVLYMFIGVLISVIKNGQAEIPNHKFWTEFGEYVKIGFMSVITCGKYYAGDPIPSQSYETFT